MNRALIIGTLSLMLVAFGASGTTSQASNKLPAPSLQSSPAISMSGDVDCSGTADSDDALQVLRQVAGLLTSAQCLSAGDVDCSGDTNSMDVLDILRHAAGLPVTLPPGCAAIGGQQATSDQLIEKALSSGALDGDTALLYRVYAAFGDGRLPPEFKGDDTNVRDTGVGADVAAQWDGLRPGTQSLLAPFRVPPAYNGSWLEPNGAAHLAAFEPICSDLASDFNFIFTANGKAKVWYQEGNSADAAKAQQVADAIDSTIWPKVTGLMGREPFGDRDVSNCNGDDERLDFYLVDIANMGETWPYTGCDNTPAFILIRRSLSGSVLLATVAHEFMHAVQDTYKLSAGCDEYRWLKESTATWTEEFVYHPANTEHAYANDFLSVPEKPLETREGLHHYGAYLWPLYLAHETGDGVVKQIWDNTTQYDSLKAADSAVGGGFEQRWPEFAKYNVNKEPVDHYKQWDGVQAGALMNTTELDLQSDNDADIPLPVDLPHLSATYYRFTFTDDDVRSVAFYNGFSYKLSHTDFAEPDEAAFHGTTYDAEPLEADQGKGASVQALVKIGGSWQELDWTHVPFKTYCRDKTDERIEEMVVIFSNSNFEPRDARLKAQGLDSRLWASTMPCWQWQGTWDATGELPGFPGSNVTIQANQLTWERDTGPDCSGNPTSASTPKAFECYTLKEGSVQMTIGGSWSCGDYSGHLSFDPSTGAGAPLTFLHTYNYVTEGDIYRSYAAAALADGNIEVSCGGQSVDQAPIGFWLIIVPFDDPGPPQFMTTPDGKMEGDLNPVGNGFLIDAHMHWSFEAKRQ